MTKTFVAFLISILFFAQHAVAQKHNNTWLFGSSAGLEFNSNPPAATEKTSANGVQPPHYISSISDNSGSLLFYTDGFTVWNNAHEVVPKYQYRWPWSGYVMPLICPVPANDTLYYLFGVSKGSYANRLQYVTINLKKPQGAIVYPQPSTISNYFTVLLQNAAVALAGTAHCNQKDNWIVAYADGAMHSFLVTKNGVSAAPVVSAVGAALSNKLEVGNSNFKFSANGEKMLVPMPNRGQVAVLDFNNLSGTFSNPVLLSVPNDYILEDVEIAADGSKLYIASYEVTNPQFSAENHFIHQMDLDAGTAAEIQKTVYAIGQGTSVICSPRYCVSIRRTMQLGPDGKIYVSMRSVDETLSVIEEPTRKGADAFYREDVVNVKQLYGVIGFNYIRSGSFNPKENGIQVQKQVCTGQPAAFSLLFKQVDSVKWDFGDPASADNFSTSFTPAHVYPGPGKYTVKAILFKNCFSDTATTVVTIQNTKAVAIPDFIKDTVVCKAGPLLLNVANATATTYTWENGYKFSKREIKEPGRYELVMMNACSYDRRAFNVQFEECACELFVPTAFTPNNDGLNDVFRPVVKCLAQDYVIKVFNRYGSTAYVSTGLQGGWDGTIKKAPAPSGVYVWTLQYRNPNNNELIFKQGTVVLVR